MGKENCGCASTTAKLSIHLPNWMPSIDSIVNEVAKWKFISTLDLKSAYHEIKIRPDDRSYTAFQSGKELYQWKVMPFGLTNAVPAFQRVMHSFIEKYQLKGVNIYLDNLTVGGFDQASHDDNLKALKKAARKKTLLLMKTNAITIARKFNF